MTRLPAALAAVLTLGVAAPLVAQRRDQATDSQPPGWTITPQLGVSQTWDDNPTLASDGSADRLGDYITTVRSDLATDFRGRRTAFTLGYGGLFAFYRDLPDLNTQDHRGSLDFSHQLTRRVSIFARDQAIFSPTTGDLTDLQATVLRRRTTRMNVFHGGFDATLARHTALTATYSTEWVDFETAENDPSTAFLKGGHSHGGSGSLRQQVSPRVTIGADYAAERAVTGEAEELFDVHSVLAVGEVAVARHVDASFGYGHAWLFAGDGLLRNGPAFRLGLEWHGRHAVGRVGYSRAFLPSFGFGGTFQNEEFHANLNAPFGRWFTWGGGVGATKSDPLTEGNPRLRTNFVQSSLAVTVKRRLRLAAVGSHAFQDSSGVGGRVHTTRLGVQASIATPVRAR